MEVYIFFIKLEKHKILCYHYVILTIYSVFVKNTFGLLIMKRGMGIDSL